MTEAEWLTCVDPCAMVETATQSPRATKRVCRLYLAAFWGWQPLRLPQEKQSELLDRVASTEHWAETGRLPNGLRASRSTNIIFFNSQAKRAVSVTVGAPCAEHWGDLAAGAIAIQPALLREIFGNPFRPV